MLHQFRVLSLADSFLKAGAPFRSGRIVKPVINPSGDDRLALSAIVLWRGAIRAMQADDAACFVQLHRDRGAFFDRLRVRFLLLQPKDWLALSRLQLKLSPSCRHKINWPSMSR